MRVITGACIAPGKRGRATAALLALLILAGGSISRLIASPSLAGPQLGLTATGDELGLVLMSTMVRNGPGAWVLEKTSAALAAQYQDLAEAAAPALRWARRRCSAPAPW